MHLAGVSLSVSLSLLKEEDGGAGTWAGIQSGTCLFVLIHFGIHLFLS